MDNMVIELYENGVPVKDMQEILGITIGTIYYYLRKHGIKANRKKKYKDDYVKAVIEDYREGMSLAQLKEKYFIYVDSLIYRYIDGDRKSFLTYEQKQDLKKMLDRDTVGQIARNLNITPSAVCYHKKQREE